MKFKSIETHEDRTCTLGCYDEENDKHVFVHLDHEKLRDLYQGRRKYIAPPAAFIPYIISYPSYRSPMLDKCFSQLTPKYPPTRLDELDHDIKQYVIIEKPIILAYTNRAIWLVQFDNNTQKQKSFQAKYSSASTARRLRNQATKGI